MDRRGRKKWPNAPAVFNLIRFIQLAKKGRLCRPFFISENKK
jgi:hypothetical protein